MEKYRRALKKSLGTLLKLPHVTGVGYGLKNVGMERTNRPALIIFVEKKLPPAELRREQVVPGKIDGLDTDVIEIGRVRLLDLRSGRERPARPGMSIGHYKITAGTFGAVVKDKSTGDRLILSNNHILANATDGRDGRALTGDPILQPGPCDNTWNGPEKAEKPGWSRLFQWVHVFLKKSGKPLIKILHQGTSPVMERPGGSCELKSTISPGAKYLFL